MIPLHYIKEREGTFIIYDAEEDNFIFYYENAFDERRIISKDYRIRNALAAQFGSVSEFQSDCEPDEFEQHIQYFFLEA